MQNVNKENERPTGTTKDKRRSPPSLDVKKGENTNYKDNDGIVF